MFLLLKPTSGDILININEIISITSDFAEAEAKDTENDYGIIYMTTTGAAHVCSQQLEYDTREDAIRDYNKITKLIIMISNSKGYAHE